MRISERRAQTLEYLKHQRYIKASKEQVRRHEAIVMRDLEEKEKIFKSRNSAMLMHEDENKKIHLARQKQIDEHQDFLKKSPLLNII